MSIKSVRGAQKAAMVKDTKPERLPNVSNVPKNTLGPQFDFIQSS